MRVLGHWYLRTALRGRNLPKSDHVAGPKTDRTLMPSTTDSTPCTVIRKRPTNPAARVPARVVDQQTEAAGRHDVWHDRDD